MHIQTNTNSTDRGEAYEADHVHSVYEEIASHFSSTRYKPWPIVEKFLRDLPTGSVGLDIGCGNGKYLAVNPDVFIIASDRSTNLTKIASDHQPHSAIVADTLALPHPAGLFDFAISIAVVHHLSTKERRVAAIRAILQVLRPAAAGGGSGYDRASSCSSSSPSSDLKEQSPLHTGGKALIYVWALEQKGSRRGWTEDDEQDVLVPWVLQAQQTEKAKEKRVPKARRARGDLEGDSLDVTPTREDGMDQSMPDTAQPSPPKVYQRYYHLYKKGELEHDVQAAGGLVLASGYEKDNWWAIAALAG